jgi:hypothetical protein
MAPASWLESGVERVANVCDLVGKAKHSNRRKMRLRSTKDYFLTWVAIVAGKAKISSKLSLADTM